MPAALLIPGPPYPLPEWAQPWAVAAFVGVFVIVLVWSIRQRTR